MSAVPGAMPRQLLRPTGEVGLGFGPGSLAVSRHGFQQLPGWSFTATQ